ncbi:MAG TPA: hypothetical protein VHD87_17165 [Acidimicrobiales bacterium]|nr:hypothetical protein [Acidimicrobiales bacterium]
MVAVAHFPASLDKGPLERLRRPLAAVAATLLVIDLMGLGMHYADSAQNPYANETPTRAKTSIGGPEAVVPGASLAIGPSADDATTAQPTGCLRLDSGCYAGPPAPSASPTPNGTATTPAPSGGSTGTPAPAPTPAATPVVQAGVGVPALGTQVSLGVGDNSCTGLTVLAALAIGDCPAPSGSGPITLNLGGSLLGGK